MEPMKTKTLAEIYLKQGHLQEAYDIFKALAEKDPSDQEVRERLRDSESENLESALPPPLPLRRSVSREERIQTPGKMADQHSKPEEKVMEFPFENRLMSAQKMIDSEPARRNSLQQSRKYSLSLRIYGKRRGPRRNSGGILLSYRFPILDSGGGGGQGIPNRPLQEEAGRDPLSPVGSEAENDRF